MLFMIHLTGVLFINELNLINIIRVVFEKIEVL